MPINVFPPRLLWLLAISALLFSPSLATATIWNVPGDAATIQGGIDLAADGDTVLVDPGTWSGAGNVNISFGGVDLVLLSSGGRDVTTIDCGSTTRGVVFSNGETAAAIMQGFTIRNGSAPTGGGILIDESSPIIRNCRFVSCYASNHGGAADLQATSAPVFEDCLFDSNSTSGDFHWGGAVQILDGASFVRCTFRDNLSGYAGGAVRVDGAGDVTFESCTFERNTGTDGGAVVDQSAVPTSFESCTFVENHATSSGGALRLGGARHTFTECFFDQNSCDFGGVMYVTLGDAVLQNCTVVRTTSDPTSAALVVVNSGSDIDLINTIIYGSLSGAAVECRNYGDITPVCSDLFGNAHGDWDTSCGAGEDMLNGNISADPLFCDPDNGDFTLAADSPCLAENSECGELIGAFGEGCDPTPVLISGFRASTMTNGVQVSWELHGGEEPASFRLAASTANRAWEVPVRETRTGHFEAWDDSPHLQAGGAITYELYYRADGGVQLLVWQQEVSLNELPARASLSSPYPNPFNPRTTIRYAIPAPGQVTLDIYDSRGRQVVRLEDEFQVVGSHEAHWDGRDRHGREMPSGCYIARLATEQGTVSQKMALTR